MWILLLYVFLVWVLLGAMIVAMLHAAKTIVRYVARSAECAEPAVDDHGMSHPARVARASGLGAPERASAARASSWPAPAAPALVRATPGRR